MNQIKQPESMAFYLNEIALRLKEGKFKKHATLQSYIQFFSNSRSCGLITIKSYYGLIESILLRLDSGPSFTSNYLMGREDKLFLNFVLMPSDLAVKYRLILIQMEVIVIFFINLNLGRGLYIRWLLLEEILLIWNWCYFGLECGATRNFCCLEQRQDSSSF